MKNFTLFFKMFLFLILLSPGKVFSDASRNGPRESFIDFSGKDIPVVDFSASLGLIIAGNNISFTDLSSAGGTSWVWNFQGGTPSIYLGKVPPPITYNSAGNFDVSLTVVWPDTVITETKTAFINVVNLPADWNFTATGSSHLISVPINVVFPSQSLAYGDFIGVFYINQDGIEKCGGAAVWDGINGKVVVAFGDDATTTTLKEGFAANEMLIWKSFLSAISEENYAAVLYNAALPNKNGKFQDNGLSALTTIVTPGFPPMSITVSANPESVCEGDEVQLSVDINGGSGDFTFSWTSVPAGFTSDQQNPLAYPVQDVTYNVVVSDGFTSESAAVEVTVSPAPFANAGANTIICENETVILMAEAGNHCGILWQSNGLGFFDDPYSLSSTYFPSPIDIQNGEVELCLTALPCSPCAVPAVDCIAIEIIQQVTIDIIIDQATICYEDSFDFTGLVDAANYENLQWFTTGGGFFSPDNNVLEPIYYPSPVIDYPQGCIQISVTAFSVNPCELALSDNFTLCFQAPPLVNAGDNATICEDETVITMAYAENHCGILWQTSGTGFFDDPASAGAVYFPSAIDISNGSVDLCVTALPCAPCAEPITDCITLTIGKIHTITIPSGWSGVSSFIEPFESDIEFIMSPAIQELIIMYNLQGETLFPEEEINTLINWDRLSGYVIKTSGEAQIALCGADPANKTIQLTEGWNLIPILSEDDLSVADIFLPILDKLIIVQEVAGVKLYYPEFGINTLDYLESGKTYFVKVSEACTISFP
ncbi:MAG: PKD domain-containing protein [Bacteroidales bacterium]|nr:PKD domain-containing protein [Bacteroidales bacterium]